MDEIPHALKQCTGCNQSFPPTSEHFPKNRRGKLAAWCKICTKAYSDRYYQEHKKQVSEKGKQHYIAHRSEILERQQKYVEANKEKVLARRERYKVTRKEYERERYIRNRKKNRERNKLYHEKHKERLNEYTRRYRKVHGERLNEKKRRFLRTEIGRLADKAHQHRRRAQKQASGGTHTASQIQEQIQRQKSRCYYCRNKLKKGKYQWHIDHVVPLSRGGSNDISNIVITCPTCNLKKNDKLPHEWAEGNRLL